MKQYLFAVQDANGREVASWSGEVQKVSDVTVTRGDGLVFIVTPGADVSGEDPGGELTLHRWPADDKLAESVKHRVA